MLIHFFVHPYSLELVTLIIQSDHFLEILDFISCTFEYKVVNISLLILFLADSS